MQLLDGINCPSANVLDTEISAVKVTLVITSLFTSILIDMYFKQSYDKRPNMQTRLRQQAN